MSTYTNSEDLNYKNMDNSQIQSTPKTKAVSNRSHTGYAVFLATVLSEDLAMILFLHKAVSHMSTDFEAAAL